MENRLNPRLLMLSYYESTIREIDIFTEETLKRADDEENKQKESDDKNKQQLSSSSSSRIKMPVSAEEWSQLRNDLIRARDEIIGAVKKAEKETLQYYETTTRNELNDDEKNKTWTKMNLAVFGEQTACPKFNFVFTIVQDV